MADKGSVRAYAIWREAAEKLDYFLAGLSAALVGYLAPKLPATRVACDPTTLELFALLLLVASLFAGFKKIESSVHLLRVGHAKLMQLESGASLTEALKSGVQVFAKTAGATLEPEQVKVLAPQPCAACRGSQGS